MKILAYILMLIPAIFVFAYAALAEH